MLDSAPTWWLASRLPVLFTARALHVAALHAVRAQAWPVAEQLFERAAARYRVDVSVESLARLRVHQLIGRLRAAAGSAREESLRLEAEQRLARLDRIESLDPPFALVPAVHLAARMHAHAQTASPPAEAALDAAA
ncbi:MAG TPA: hypothetical protein VJY35_01805 [Candidatus Eisenbacteria bacterium]|nr:hypothetical protein [Candidatus Eisenbacteria bacterium]